MSYIVAFVAQLVMLQPHARKEQHYLLVTDPCLARILRGGSSRSSYPLQPGL